MDACRSGEATGGSSRSRTNRNSRIAGPRRAGFSNTYVQYLAGPPGVTLTDEAVRLYPFASGVGNLGRFCEALDEPRRARFKRGAADRLGSPSGAFRLTATAWYVRGTVPAG